MKEDVQQTKATQRFATSAPSDSLVELSSTFVFLVLVSAVLTGTGWLLFQAFRGLVWTFGVAASYVGAIGWIVTVPLIALAIWETVSRLKPRDDAWSPSDGPNASSPSPKRARTRGLLCAVSAAVIMSGNLCLNIAAGRIETHWQSRQQHTTEIYKNHDLAKLVGQCIRLAILRHAKDLPKGDERAALETVASIAPVRWAAMIDTDGGKQPDPRVLALADAKLTQFIQKPEAEALHQPEWASLLTDWRDGVKGTALTDATLHAAAANIAKDFGITLREALKSDFKNGGKAWAAMQLDIAQQLLNRTPVSLEKSSPEIKAALIEVKAMLADDAKAIDTLNTIISDVRQSQEAHAVAVEAHFDEVVGMIRKIVDDVTIIKTQTAAGLTNDAINARIKQIDIDPTLSIDEKREQMQPLLAQIINNQPANASRIEVPAQVQQAVERTFAGATEIVRFAALARVGLDKEADELAAEIERTTAGLSDADKYEFFVARGDRYWNASDFWNAATWYAQAMALRVDDPAVVHRAAQSATLAPGKATYTQDVQLAQSWVERCLAKLSKQTEASVIDTARLHGTLAITLLNQGKSSAGIAPSREALRLLERLHDAPSGQAYEVLVDAAQSLLQVGAVAEAAVASERAVAAAEAFASAASDAAAFTYAFRARVRERIGLLNEAEEDIDNAIAWHEAQSPRNERTLALYFVSRAHIRQTVGLLKEADEDLAKAIAWNEAQSPRDDRGLSIDYHLRASIRQQLGFLKEAEEDIAKSIAYFVDQFPRDERALAIRYSLRASIRQNLGLLKEAEEDIAKAIVWGEAQSPREELGLAQDYARRASIYGELGKLKDGENDINKSIALFMAQSPRDERSLSILYGSRARFRLAFGLLKEAEDDIAKSIAWEEAQSPRDELGLAISYALRARLYGKLGLLKKGEEEITKSISYVEAHYPSNERGLAILYADRADIRLSLGLLEDAADDIAKSIAWYESQSPINDRYLSIAYASRARIRNAQRQYPDALADIERSLAWANSQRPFPHWGIPVWSCIRANILSEVDRIPEAVADIATSVAWHRQYHPNNKPDLARILRDQARIHACAAKQRESEADWPAASAAITESLRLHEAVFGKDHEWTSKTRVWQVKINAREIPPRWLDTKP